MKPLSPTELRSSGILQEANRLFFHPAGLALTVEFHDDEDALGNTLPGRCQVVSVTGSDDEGMELTNPTAERAETFRRLSLTTRERRQEVFGWPDGVQPL